MYNRAWFVMPPSKLNAAIPLSLPASLSDLRASPSSVDAHDLVLRALDDCGPGLRRYVGSFGLGADATDDVVQEVFLSLFRHVRLGRPRTHVKGWLFRVAHNLALKHRQQRSRRLQTETEWDVTLAERLVDPAATPEQVLADDRRMRRLRRVLEALPERDRRCVYLRAEGLCYRDIASTLGISLGTVAKSLVRAIARLARADTE